MDLATRLANEKGLIMGKTWEEYRHDAWLNLPAGQLGCVEALDGAAAALWAADGPHQEGDRPNPTSEFAWRDGRLDMDEAGADSEAYHAAEAAGEYDATDAVVTDALAAIDALAAEDANDAPQCGDYGAACCGPPPDDAWER